MTIVMMTIIIKIGHLSSASAEKSTRDTYDTFAQQLGEPFVSLVTEATGGLSKCALFPLKFGARAKLPEQVSIRKGVTVRCSGEDVLASTIVAFYNSLLIGWDFYPKK